MELIDKLLNTEEVTYSSNLNEESLKKRIQDLSEQRTLRFAGKLISENEFTAYDKWVIVGWDMPNLKRKSAYLRGEISKGEKGALINLIVSPNSMLPLFGILATLIGVIAFIVALSNTGGDKFFQYLGLLFIALGIIYYSMSTLVRNRFCNRIIKYLDLNRV